RTPGVRPTGTQDPPSGIVRKTCRPRCEELCTPHPKSEPLDGFSKSTRLCHRTSAIDSTCRKAFQLIQGTRSHPGRFFLHLESGYQSVLPVALYACNRVGCRS